MDMDEKDRIKKLLAAWNPLEVPAELAETEYADYVDIIISNMRSNDELQTCLTKILVEQMGLTISVPDGVYDIERICNELIKKRVKDTCS
jgi:vacuolar-type H+-ATPase subunit C/Vma6